MVMGISGALLASGDSQTTQVPEFKEVGDGTLVSTQNLCESLQEDEDNETVSTVIDSDSDQEENPDELTGSRLVRTQRIPAQEDSLFDWARDLNRHK